MPIDEDLALRMREVIEKKYHSFTEKKMVGGVTFMYKGKMCCGITNNGTMMTRVPKDRYEELLKHEHAKEMDFTGRPMKGFLYIDGEGSGNPDDLAYWIALGMEYVDGEVG